MVINHLGIQGDDPPSTFRDYETPQPPLSGAVFFALKKWGSIVYLGDVDGSENQQQLRFVGNMSHSIYGRGFFFTCHMW